jgi:hypothetical protein
MKRRILVVLLAFALALIPTVPVYADTYQDVTVTATPAYISITNGQATWTINGITGSGVIETSTTYYSNPLGDTTPPTATVDTDEGYFPITNDSTIDIDIVVDMEDFSGGDADMTNGETGSAGATSYGAYSWYEGCTYADDKVIVKKNGTGSDTLWQSSSPGDDIDLGVTISTQTDAWAGGGSSTATLKFSASAT